jgi:Sap, sulfolipid-1-addressing protein
MAALLPRRVTGMLGEAAGFALLAAISPTALLVMAVFLSSASPRQAALMYVAGAMLMTVAMAVAVLYVLRAAGLNQPREQEPRYALRLALGVLALIAVGVIALRGQKAAGGSSETGLMSRIVARPTALAAFVAGIVLFAPSATFIAAVQVVATANVDVPVTVLALVIVVVVTVLIVWLPLLAYLAAPDATTQRLNLLNGWLRVRGRMLAIGVLTIAGIVLIVNGALGLAGVL